jgi:Family of unknown function (DUF6221)
MDITEFVGARLNEDEAAAREACDGDSGRWFTGDKWTVYREEDEARCDQDYQGDEHAIVARGNVKPQAEHIGRYDPARALRGAAAKRAIAKTAAHLAAYGDKPIKIIGEVMMMELAAIWSDHPDYRQEWSI